MEVESKTPASERKFVSFYSAYFLKCLEERIWWFFLITSLAELGSLGFLSGEQLMEGLLQVLASTYLGTLVDRFSRKKGLITILISNHFTMLAAAVSLIACYSTDSNSSKCLLLTMFFSVFNRLFLNAEKSMLSKDWMLVIRGDQNLSTLNWRLQIFDQIASVFGPIYTGQLLTVIENKAIRASLVLLTLIFTMSLRSALLAVLYCSDENLATPKKVSIRSRTKSSSSLRIYHRQESFLAAFGACLLFMTVMGFGSVAIGYATRSGVSMDSIGILKALAAILAFVGGGLYAVLERRYGINTAGIVGLLLHQTFVILVVGSVFLPGSSMDIRKHFESFELREWWEQVQKSFSKTRKENGKVSLLDSTSTSILVFLIASAFTLIGQSCLETSIKHIMQMSVPETERNTVFGVQNSISKGFTMLKDLLVIGFQSPEVFPILIFVSYAFVSSGHLFYVLYVLRSRSRNFSEKKRRETEMVHLNEEESL